MQSKHGLLTTYITCLARSLSGGTQEQRFSVLTLANEAQDFWLMHHIKDVETFQKLYVEERGVPCHPLQLTWWWWPTVLLQLLPVLPGVGAKVAQGECNHRPSIRALLKLGCRSREPPHPNLACVHSCVRSLKQCSLQPTRI